MGKREITRPDACVIDTCGCLHKLYVSINSLVGLTLKWIVTDEGQSKYAVGSVHC